QQINGSLLYRAQLWPRNNIHELQENFQLDFDASFLEDQLDRPQISDKEIDDSQQQGIEMFQQTTANIIVPDLPDLHIIEQLRGSNIENAENSNLRIPLAPLVNNNSNDGYALAPLVNNDSNNGYALAPLVNNDSNGSHALNNNIEKPCKESKRRYLCNVCGGVGHNARICKQQK
ncbi:16569_t:CDS:2, partial [Gigaspora rosea]